MQSLVFPNPLLPHPQSGSSLQSLWNSLFWIAVALAAVLALHVGIRALIIWRAWPMPLFFEVGCGQAAVAVLLGTVVCSARHAGKSLVLLQCTQHFSACIPCALT